MADEAGSFPYNLLLKWYQPNWRAMTLQLIEMEKNEQDDSEVEMS